MKAKICISILPKTIDEALNLIDRAEKYHPDFIEVRLDYFKAKDKEQTKGYPMSFVKIVATTIKK